jgi:hypothetical protein
MKTHLLLTALACATLAACAAPPRTWVKTDATDTQFAKDRAECRYEAAKSANQVNPSYRSSFGQELDLSYRRGEIYDLCLQAKGYMLK